MRKLFDGVYLLQGEVGGCIHTQTLSEFSRSTTLILAKAVDTEDPTGTEVRKQLDQLTTR